MEFSMSRELLPFVTKVYETNGLIMVAEYVTVISKEEFLQNKEKIRGILSILAEGYLLGDVGSITKNYMNWGYRDDGELVILDFAFIYRVIGNEMRCHGKNKAGEECHEFLNYDENYDMLVCPHCGKKYSFMDIRRRIDLKIEEQEIINSKRIAYQLKGPKLVIHDDNSEEEIKNHQAKKRKVVDSEEFSYKDIDVYYEGVERKMEDKRDITNEEFDSLFEKALEFVKNNNIGSDEHIRRNQELRSQSENDIEPIFNDCEFDDYEPSDVVEARNMRYFSSDPIGDYLHLPDEYDIEEEECEYEEDPVADYLHLPDVEDDEFICDPEEMDMVESPIDTVEEVEEKPYKAIKNDVCELECCALDSPITRIPEPINKNIETLKDNDSVIIGETKYVEPELMPEAIQDFEAQQPHNNSNDYDKESKSDVTEKEEPIKETPTINNIENNISMTIIVEDKGDDEEVEKDMELKVEENKSDTPETIVLSYNDDIEAKLRAELQQDAFEQDEYAEEYDDEDDDYEEEYDDLVDEARMENINRKYNKGKSF